MKRLIVFTIATLLLSSCCWSHHRGPSHCGKCCCKQQAQAPCAQTGTHPCQQMQVVEPTSAK